MSKNIFMRFVETHFFSQLGNQMIMSPKYCSQYSSLTTNTTVRHLNSYVCLFFSESPFRSTRQMNWTASELSCTIMSCSKIRYVKWTKWSLNTSNTNSLTSRMLKFNFCSKVKWLLCSELQLKPYWKWVSLIWIKLYVWIFILLLIFLDWQLLILFSIYCKIYPIQYIVMPKSVAGLNQQIQIWIFLLTIPIAVLIEKQTNKTIFILYWEVNLSECNELYF